MGRAFEYRKARKMKRWSAMAKVNSRISKDIVIAIKEGSGISDPDSNSRLRAVMQNARSLNVNKTVIERAIKKATDKDTANYKEAIFEGYAPHGIAVLVETATDNNNRTVANVRSYFNKSNGSLGTAGSVAFMFEHNCQFKIDKGEHDPEELELELIDHGAEEIFVDEGDEETPESIMIYGAFESFGSLQAALEGMSVPILSSGFERIPNVTKALNEEQAKEVEKIIDKLEEDEDVMNVYHTMVLE